MVKLAVVLAHESVPVPDPDDESVLREDADRESNRAALSVGADGPDDSRIAVASARFMRVHGKGQ